MNPPGNPLFEQRRPQPSCAVACGRRLSLVHWLGYLKVRKVLIAALSIAGASGLNAADTSDARTKIEIFFDDGYSLEGSLADQEHLGWRRLLPFASPVIKVDSAGRPGAFSSGGEMRALLPTDAFDTSLKSFRLEFAAAIPAIKAHQPSFVQIGFAAGSSGERNPVITVSATGLLFGKGMGISEPDVKKAYRGAEPFRPAHGKTIHVRCDFDPEANTASISVSEDGGETYEELSASAGGERFTFEPSAFFDHIYLRLGTSPATGIYSIVVSQ